MFGVVAHGVLSQRGSIVGPSTTHTGKRCFGDTAATTRTSMFVLFACFEFVGQVLCGFGQVAVTRQHGKPLRVGGGCAIT